MRRAGAPMAPSPLRTTLPATRGPKFSVKWASRRLFSCAPPWPVSAALRMRNAIYAADTEVFHRGRQLGHRRQQHAGVLLPRPAHRPAKRRQQLGLLDFAARGAPPSDDRDVG